MKRYAIYTLLLPLLSALLLLSPVTAQDAPPTLSLRANALLDSLTDEQRAATLKPFDDASRTKWHYIPMDDRKGLDLRALPEAKQAAVFDLLRAAAGEHGYALARDTMKREALLFFLEKKDMRDPMKYYLTLFGAPGDGKWGLSFEGHHLSLNYSFYGDFPISATPMFLGINPGIVKKSGPSLPPVGDQILKVEETLAIDLATSLIATDSSPIEADQPERDIKEAGHATIKDLRRRGIKYANMTKAQQKQFFTLVQTYLAWLPPATQAHLLCEIDFPALAFAWSGPIDTSKQHSYRIANKDITILYYNTLGDSLGNKPNHAHAIIRVADEDFGAIEIP